MIAIIKYNAGNATSVSHALRRLGGTYKITDRPEEIEAADKVIFPGVGEASSAMNYLKKTGLDQTIRRLQQPVLGICLGLQLLCRKSEENDTECLGIFDTDVRRFPAKGIIPHIGWNSLENIRGNLMDGITQESDVYFVHSYYAELSEQTKATCSYLLPFSAVLQKDNFYATQFHPEKSGAVGQGILENFLKIILR